MSSIEKNTRRIRCFSCGSLVLPNVSERENYAVRKLRVGNKRGCICLACFEEMALDNAFLDEEDKVDEEKENTSIVLVKGNSSKISEGVDKKKEEQMSETTKEEDYKLFINEMYPCLEYSLDSIVNVAKECVIGQDKALRNIAYVIYFNQMSAFLDDFSKIYVKPTNAIILGNTGVGKSYSLKTLLKIMRVPYHIFNVTTVTSAGYVGDKVEHALEGLYHAAEKNLERAERGVLVLEEIDKKVAESARGDRDVAGKAVQQELLKLMEPSKVRIEKGTIEFDTSHLTVILCGAFVGLDEIVDKRLDVKKIGFKSDEKEQEERNVLPIDIINYGFIPEFVGRIPKYIPLKKLTKRDVVDIIYISKDSILRQLAEMFRVRDIVLSIDDMVIEDIADEVLESSTGARDIEMKIKGLLEPALYKVFQHRTGGLCDIDADKKIRLILKEKDGTGVKYVEEGG